MNFYPVTSHYNTETMHRLPLEVISYFINGRGVTTKFLQNLRVLNAIEKGGGVHAQAGAARAQLRTVAVFLILSTKSLLWARGRGSEVKHEPYRHRPWALTSSKQTSLQDHFLCKRCKASTLNFSDYVLCYQHEILEGLQVKDYLLM